MITIYVLILHFFFSCQNKLFHFFPNYDSILRWKMKFSEKILYGDAQFIAVVFVDFLYILFLVFFTLCHILYSKYFLKEWPLVLTSYEICQREYFYILCVLNFPIFWFIYLWRAFCYLVVFQRVIVGCWIK